MKQPRVRTNLVNQYAVHNTHRKCLPYKQKENKQNKKQKKLEEKHDYIHHTACASLNYDLYILLVNVNEYSKSYTYIVVSGPDTDEMEGILGRKV